jgi:hypothetical protein
MRHLKQPSAWAGTDSDEHAPITARSARRCLFSQYPSQAGRSDGPLTYPDTASLKLAYPPSWGRSLSPSGKSHSSRGSGHIVVDHGKSCAKSSTRSAIHTEIPRPAVRPSSRLRSSGGFKHLMP